MDYGSLLLITLQLLACYTEWVISFGGIVAEFDACVEPGMDVQVLWDCITAYAEQLTAISNEYYGCFTQGD